MYSTCSMNTHTKYLACVRDCACSFWTHSEVLVTTQYALINHPDLQHTKQQ